MFISDVLVPPAKNIRAITSQQPRETTRDSSLLPSKETDISNSRVPMPPKKRIRTNTSQQPRDSTRLLEVSTSPAKKSQTIMRQEQRETTRDSYFLLSKKPEARLFGLHTSPAKKSQTSMIQQPPEITRDSSLSFRSKKNDLLLFGVYMTPGKKMSMRQEPRKILQYSFLKSKEMEVKMSLSSASPMIIDEDLKKATNCLEKEEEKRSGVSTELTLFTGDPWIIKKKLDKSDIAVELKKVTNCFEDEEKRSGVSTELTLSITDPWIIKKKLDKSDISKHLYLSNAVTEIHILRPISEDDQENKLRQGNGLMVNVYDTDTHTTHGMLLLRLKTRQTHYCLTNSWHNDFVYRRGLKIGDEIGLYWARSYSELHFRVLSRGNADEKKLLVPY